MVYLRVGFDGQVAVRVKPCHFDEILIINGTNLYRVVFAVAVCPDWRHDDGRFVELEIEGLVLLKGISAAHFVRDPDRDTFRALRRSRVSGDAEAAWNLLDGYQRNTRLDGWHVWRFILVFLRASGEAIRRSIRPTSRAMSSGESCLRSTQYAFALRKLA
jgi:hypothetical protein